MSGRAPYATNAAGGDQLATPASIALTVRRAGLWTHKLTHKTGVLCASNVRFGAVRPVFKTRVRLVEAAGVEPASTASDTRESRREFWRGVLHPCYTKTAALSH
jgi:hypothetical protein